MTKIIVADDTLGEFARRQHDWFERVRKGSLDPERAARAVQAVIDQGSSSFRFDFRKKGWVLLNDVSRRITSANIGKTPILNESESFVGGEEMVSQANGLGLDYGQEDAEWLLDHQNKIPTKLRGFNLVFPGTEWEDLDGRSLVPFLKWTGSEWNLGLLPIEKGLKSFDYFVSFSERSESGI